MIEIETMDKAFPVCFFSLSIYLGFPLAPSAAAAYVYCVVVVVD
jgi:hypothetical protein